MCFFFKTSLTLLSTYYMYCIIHVVLINLPVYASGRDDHFIAIFSPSLSPLWSQLLCWNPPVATRWSAHFCAYSLRSLACFSGGAYIEKTTTHVYSCTPRSTCNVVFDWTFRRHLRLIKQYLCRNRVTGPN